MRTDGNVCALDSLSMGNTCSIAALQLIAKSSKLREEQNKYAMMVVAF